MSATNTVSRGFVVVRTGGRVSSIVPKSQAERIAKRFGGRVVNVAGYPFRTVRGARVLIDPSKVA